VRLLRSEQASGRIPVDLLITALSNFAVLRRARGDSKAAEALLRESLTLAPELPSDAQASIGLVETLLALTWLDQGKFAEAEAYARKLVAGFRSQANPETAQLCSGLTLLGSILMEKGDLAAADASLKEAEALYRKLFDADYAPIYDNLRLQAQVYYLADRLAEAEVAIEQTIAKYREHSGSQYVHFATALTIKGLILNKTGRMNEAEKVLREAARLRAGNLPDGHFMSAITKGALGQVLTAQRRFAEAEPLLLASYQTLKHTQATENPRVVSARRRLTDLYTAWNKPELLGRVQ
jgi:tetratricopeptide (TPR) repeat protein